MDRFPIHIKSALLCAKNENTLKTYLFYLNLYRLYEEKSLHNYYSRFEFIRIQTGCSDYQIRKYTNELIRQGLAWLDPNNKKHLCLGSKFKIIQTLNVEYTDLFEDEKTILKETILKKSKFIYWTTKKHLTLFEFKGIIIRLAQEYKEIKVFKTEAKSYCKINGVTLNQIRQELIQKLARRNDKVLNFYLSLQEIRSLFGMKTKQGASYLVNQLEKEGILKIRHRFCWIRKPKGVIEKSFLQGESKKLLNGFLTVQQSNQLLYSEEFSKAYENKSKIIGFMTKIVDEFDKLVSEFYKQRKTNKDGTLYDYVCKSFYKFYKVRRASTATNTIITMNDDINKINRVNMIIK